MSCRLEEAIKDIEVLASKPGAKSIAKELLQIAKEAKESLKIQPAAEYAHHYIAMFRDTKIVQEAIKKWGSEEALVQAIGEQVVAQKGEAYGWWKKFSNWVKGLFNDLDEKSKEELAKLLTDSFLTRMDLNDPEGQRIEIYNKYLISHVFKTLPELEAIGTQEEYREYTKGIFPNTQVSRLMSHRAKIPRNIDLVEAKEDYIQGIAVERGHIPKEKIKYISDVAVPILRPASQKNLGIKDYGAGEVTLKENNKTTEIEVPLTEADYYALRGIEFKNSWWEKGNGFDKAFILSANNGSAMSDSNFKGFSFSASLDYDYNIGHSSVSDVLHPIIAKLNVGNVAAKSTNVPSNVDAVDVYQHSPLAELIVKEPDQIHILGSAKDMQMFKEWKANHQVQTNSKVDTMTSKELKEKAEEMLKECM